MASEKLDWRISRNEHSNSRDAYLDYMGGAVMGKMQRNKGARREREFCQLTGGTRVPLSGAMGGEFSNDVRAYNMDWEVKARANGFKQLYSWIEDERERPDALALKADRKEWLVCMPLSKFDELMKKVNE